MPNKESDMRRMFTAVFVLLCSLAMVAQSAPPKPPATAGEVLERQFRGMEREFVPAAEAMPADKYDFAPTDGEFKGVRTFADQAKHIAGGAFRVSAAILGEKSPVAPDAVASAKSKDQIVKLLTDAFAYTHKAFGSVTEKNLLEPIPSPFGSGGSTTRLDLAIAMMADQRDHYGQMVVYFRMNGMVPPASRR